MARPTAPLARARTLPRRALGAEPAATVAHRARVVGSAVRLGHVGVRGPRSATPVFAITQPRTGSGLLHDLLGQLDGVGAMREVLHPTKPTGAPGRVFRMAPMWHIAWCLASLDAPVPCVTMHTQDMRRVGIDLDDLARAHPGARYLATYRRSLGDVYLSFRVAAATKSWWITDGEEQPPPPSLTFDRARFEAYLREARADLDATLGHPTIREHGLVVAYEDLAADPAGVLRERIAPFLGRPVPEHVAPRLRRQRNYDVADVVRNRDEVADLLATTYEPPDR